MPEHPILTMVREKVADPSKPFTFIAELTAKPGRGDDLAAAVKSSQTVPLTRKEVGVIAYDILRDVDSPDAFVAHECWKNLAALESHLGSAHFTAIGAALEDLLAGPPTIRVFAPA
jgi:quinol monooxygenase YgiN